MSSLFDKASWLLIPSGYEEDVVFVQKPTSGGDLTFTRSSDATRTNSAGQIERVAWNLLTFSEQFENATGWSILGTRFTSSKVTGPTGTNNAYLFTEVVATDSHNVFTVAGNRPTSEAGRTYTVSAYFKAGTRRYCGISVGIGGSGVHVFVDTTNWTITDAKRFSTNTNWVYLSSTIQADLNGFYRVSLTFRTDAALSMSTSIFASNVSTSTAGEPSYLGDGSTIITTGAQLVEGTEAKPYLMTTNRQDVPRLDYRNADGTVSSCPRLLLEPQRTNVYIGSEQLIDNIGVDGVSNNATAPDGSNSADTIIEQTNLNRHFTGCPIMNAGSTTVTASVFLKYVDIQYAQLCVLPAGGISFSAIFDIVNGTVTATRAEGTATYLSSKIENYGNGWFRCSITGISTQASNFFNVGLSPTATFGTLVFQMQYYTGTGKSIRIWGKQLEAGAYPTTYIPTTTAAVTRTADTLSRDNVFTNGYITSAGGTWFVDLYNTAQFVRSQSNFALFLSTVNSGFGGNGFVLYNTGSTAQRLTLAKYVSGTITTIHVLTSDNTKLAIKWNGSTADVFENGVKVVSATSFTGTNMQFIGNQSLPVPININQMMLAPTPLDDEQCIALTTI